MLSFTSTKRGKKNPPNEYIPEKQKLAKKIHPKKKKKRTWKRLDRKEAPNHSLVLS